MLSLTTMRLIVIITILLSSLCEAILPRYLPVVQQNNLQRDDLIQRYFHLGLQQWEILVFLMLTPWNRVKHTPAQASFITQRTKTKEQHQ